MPVSYKGVLINYNPTNPAYRVWDYTKQRVYNVAAPAFDKKADPRWWRTPDAILQDEDEPLLFLESPPPPTGPSAPVSEIIDSSPDDDTPDDDASTLPLVQPAPALAVLPVPIVLPLPDQTLGLQEVPGPRRSTRENRGVPLTRTADMLMAATLEISDTNPKTYKQVLRLPNAAKWVGACAGEVAFLVKNKVFEVVDRPVCTSFGNHR